MGAALGAVCGTIAELAGCDRVQVWRGDLRQLTMHVLIAVGYDPIDAERIRTLRMPIQDMTLAPDFYERKVLEISHAGDLTDWSTHLLADFGIQAAMYALIERGERVLGALQLSWCGTPTPAFPLRELLDVARTYVALAVECTRADEAGETAGCCRDRDAAREHP